MNKKVLKITSICLAGILLPVAIIVLAVILSQPKEFKLTLDVIGDVENKGSVIMTVDGNPYTEEMTIERDKEVALAFSSQGYDFVGWYEGVGEGLDKLKEVEGQSFKIKMQEDFSYTLEVERIGYTVKFGASTKPLSYGDVLDIPQTAKGYKYEGWKIKGEEDDTAQKNANFEKTDRIIELEPVFSLIEYSITYNLNGGDPEENPAKYTVETETIAIAEPTKTGYTFGGWFAESDFTGNAVTEITQGSIENKELFAKWTIDTYTITYTLNDGTNAESNVAKYDVTKSFTFEAPVKTGYTFAGWFEKNDFTGNAITEIVEGSTGNKELFAKWTIDTYTITYTLNDGTNAESNIDSYNVETVNITLADPTKTGYTFGGWFAEADFKTEITEIVAGSTGNKELFAKWTVNKYTLTLNANGGTSDSSTMQITYDSKIGTLPEVSREGYTFAGWKIEETVITSETVWNYAETKTAIAQWTANGYTLTLNANGGKETVDNMTVTYDSSIGALPTLTKLGYDFAGWKIGEDNITTAIVWKYADNKTAIAQWTIVNYTISYELNGGSLVDGQINPTGYDIEDENITLKNPSKTYYHFAGWNTEEDGKGDFVKTIDTSNLENVQLYAIFKDIKISIVSINHNTDVNDPDVTIDKIDTDEGSEDIILSKFHDTELADILPDNVKKYKVETEFGNNIIKTLSETTTLSVLFEDWIEVGFSSAENITIIVTLIY